MEGKVLKLYHVQLTEKRNLTYDTYSEFVVAVYSEDEARRFHPGTEDTSSWGIPRSDWILEEEIPSLRVKFLGIAEKDVEYGMICSSFHSG